MIENEDKKDKEETHLRLYYHVKTADADTVSTAIFKKVTKLLDYRHLIDQDSYFNVTHELCRVAAFFLDDDNMPLHEKTDQMILHPKRRRFNRSNLCTCKQPKRKCSVCRVASVLFQLSTYN